MDSKEIIEKNTEFRGQRSLDQLQFNIRWLKEWKRYEVRNHHKMRQPYTIFWLVLSGSILFEIDNVQYKVEQGQLVSLPALTRYRWISIDKDTPFHHLSLACEAKVGTFDLLKMYQFPPVFSLKSAERQQQLIDHWYHLFHCITQTSGSFKSSVPSSKTSDLVMLNTQQSMDYFKALALGIQWLDLIFQSLQSELPDQPLSYDIRIFQVCEYVRRNLHTRPSLDYLASSVNLSKEHLRTLFKKELGVSPMKYMSQLRMERACEMLLLSTASIKHISESLGFEDQHYFTRTFHHFVGMSPTLYRSRYNNST